MYSYSFLSCFSARNVLIIVFIALFSPPSTRISISLNNSISVFRLHRKTEYILIAYFVQSSLINRAQSRAKPCGYCAFDFATLYFQKLNFFLVLTKVIAFNGNEIIILACISHFLSLEIVFRAGSEQNVESVSRYDLWD